ncbi:uncharacterized protein PV07_10307 [Cladophialophora immunda]|uniref:Uncharacterized protein n=1 Tax=Cladophialophora immunda TaxID=569365 RepID=A0A0D2BZT8_9EURO|nr:uncharacterized protein PV07_10307 [Cladophialophora immunda]KIW24603.1 hypothetical protein PV07_10307 [Cladophialophora immunda]OQV10886.1 hypothetical protein CLAIMM_14808 [Cladophialophora immunda]
MAPHPLEMSPKLTTAPTPAAPSPRPEMKPRSASDDSHYAITPSRTLSPTSTLSPLSTGSSPPPTRGHRTSFSFPFPRSRSKSPRPPAIDLHIPPSTSTTPAVQHTATSPTQSPSSHAPHARTTPRHISDGTVSPSLLAMATTTTSSPPGSPPGSDLQKRDSWLQKKARHSGSSPGGYGRHGDDWLFGGISLTQTAKEIVHRGRRRKEEDGDAAGNR